MDLNDTQRHFVNWLDTWKLSFLCIFPFNPSILNDMRTLIHNFIHCGILGWCLEITFTALDSFRRREFKLTGNTSIWMFPIYGMAAFLAPICKLVQNRHFLTRGSIYAALIFLGEFITGSLLMRRDLCPWNYERSRWNIKKVVRLDYLPCWIFAGLLFERLIKETSNS